EAALQLEPNDAWSVHALAHALYESESFDAGVSRLPAAIHPCRGLNWFRNHLLWHLALLHFARGEYARASDIARATFEREPSSIAGLHASAQGDYRRSIGRIEPRRPRIVELGGSRAQRDVFHDTLFEACFRAGDAERAGRYLAERLAHRRDHPWLSRGL